MKRLSRALSLTASEMRLFGMLKIPYKWSDNDKNVNFQQQNKSRLINGNTDKICSLTIFLKCCIYLGNFAKKTFQVKSLFI